MHAGRGCARQPSGPNGRPPCAAHRLTPALDVGSHCGDFAEKVARVQTLYANEAPRDEPPTSTVCNQPCDSMEANAKVDAMPLTDGMAIILAIATGLKV